MRARPTTAILWALLSAGCAAPPAKLPEVEVIRLTPPESLVRLEDRPEPPVLPALPPGAAVPRDVVVRRERAAAGVIVEQHATIGLYEARLRALRRFFGFDAPPKPAVAPAPPPAPPRPP